MKIEKAAAIPLINSDPFFSIWSAHDKLNDAGTSHWCGDSQSISGFVKIGDSSYCFLGNAGVNPKIEQTELYVTATKTTAVFENNKAKLCVDFVTPLLLDDPCLAARPVTYINFKLENKTSEAANIMVVASSNMVCHKAGLICGGSNSVGDLNFSQMGKADQSPLGESGDNITIDWGYLYLATANGETCFSEDEQKLYANAVPDLNGNASILIGYDDVVSINYFGEFKRGLWTKKDKTIVGALKSAHLDSQGILKRCEALDEQIETRARAAGGEDYVFLCNMSYRHTISAHKMIEDEEGNLIVLSKENDSNGCIGTADVSYPSIPLYMLFDTEYVKGMIRPILDFANCDVWEFDYAPHDVGRYPYAWGQVYGINPYSSKMKLVNGRRFAEGAIYPPFYNFPSGGNVYSEKYQMPVEECGNMIVMIANVCIADKSAEFAKPHIQTLKKWVGYLVKHGADPENQLCTDDFAGHLAHNVNLSFKAVMGIMGYALLSQMLGNKDEYDKYHDIAKQMTQDCLSRSKTESSTSLTYDNPESWSLKYNAIWDKIWKTNLFPEDFFDKEISCYLSKINEYGVPLDSRCAYTKSDWVLWCTAFAKDKKDREKLIAPIAHFLKNSESRVAFSDWYDTETGLYEHFIARSVQGGIFMPILFDSFDDLTAR